MKPNFLLFALLIFKTAFPVSAPPSIGTISQLKALPAGAYPTVQLLGYYSAGDGGGGELNWSSVSTAPDSCTIYKPNTNPAIGRWVRRYANPLSATACGIVSDGITDDAADFQAAINYSSGSKGTTILFKPGVVNIGATTINLLTQSKLQGSGRDSTVFKTTGGDTVFNISSAVSGVTISDIGLANVSNVANTKGFRIAGTRISLKNITLKNIKNGIWAQPTAQYVNIDGYRQYSDSNISNYGMLLFGVKDWSIKNLELRGVNFDTTGIDKGVALENGGTVYGCQRVHIDGADISHMRGYGIGGDPDDISQDYPNRTIYMLSAGYTNAVAGDIGKAVWAGGAPTGDTLIAYSNTAGYERWVITAHGTVSAAAALTINGGTGAGTCALGTNAPLYTILLDSLSYTAAVSADIGRVVMQGGVRKGILMAYDNSSIPRRWVVGFIASPLSNTATTISGGTGAGTTLYDSYFYKAPATWDCNWTHIDSRHNLSTLIGHGVSMDATFSTHLSNFVTDSNTQAGVYVGDNLSFGSTISNGTARWNKYGLCLAASAVNSISNLDLNNNSLNGIYFVPIANGLSDTVNYTHISNCQIWQNSRRRTQPIEAGIGGGMSRCVLEHNAIFENYFFNIDLTNASNNMIRHNLVADAGWSGHSGGGTVGIYLEGTSKNNLIESNWIGNRLPNNTQTYAIQYNANSDSNVARNNFMLGNATGAISDGGAGNQDWDNLKTRMPNSLANGTGNIARTTAATVNQWTLTTSSATPAASMTSTSSSSGYTLKVTGSTGSTFSPVAGVYNRNTDFSNPLVDIGDSAASGGINSTNGSYLQITKRASVGGGPIFKVWQDSLQLGDTLFNKIKIPYLRGTGTRILQANNLGDIAASTRFDTSSTFTITLTGVTASVTGTAKWTTIGHRTAVLLYVPALTGTSNSTACTLTGMPSFIQPTTAQDFPIPNAEDAGTIDLGLVSLAAASTTITLAQKSLVTGDYSTTFTNSGTKGFTRPFTIVYSLQ